ncbi:cytochrome P450 4V2-like [Ostrinia nubilalis]|uniref:cytochrome P450 4V2-like n=1 Tax=Ostrinia nubilalis TaxID=29057 RepID=UPI0030826993
MLVEIFLVLTFAWMAILWWQNRAKRDMCKYIKSDIPTYPFIGMAHRFAGSSEDKMKTLMDVGREGIKHNGWTNLWLGMRLFAVACDPAEVEFVLKTYLEKDDVLKFTQMVIGNGSIFASVPIWKPRRKVLAPTFAQRKLNHYMKVFQEQGAVMVDELRKVADKGSFSVWQFMTTYTMDSICETTLGCKLGIQRQGDHPFLHNFPQIAELVTTRILSPWLHSDFFFKVSGYYNLCMKYTNVITDFVSKIIKSRRTALKENNNTIKNDEYTPKPFLDLLIESSGGEEHGYTDRELLEESLVMLIAGTDTSAVGSSFVTVMLSQHLDKQEKVYKEIQEVFGDSDRPITAEDLPHLKYLEAFIKETLRLYPPVPITARKTDKECVTPAGTKLIPGVGVLIHMWAIHRNPRYWGEDAEEFRPERFFDSPPTHPAAYMPFSYGSRNCLGYQYAMMSMKTIITSLVRKYKVLPASGTSSKEPLRLHYDLMMKHVDNFQVKLQTRTN